MSEEDVVFRSRVLRLVWITLLGFLLLLTLAMIVYPDKAGHIGGYPFFAKHISALGMTITHDGVPNLPSCLLFNIGLGVAMLMLIPFWYIRVKCVHRNKALRIVAFGLCSGFSLGLIGVSLTPYNLLADIHNISVYSAFAFIVPGCLILVVGANQEYCSRRYKLSWFVFAIAFLLCELLLMFSSQHHLLPWWRVEPLIQKFNVGVFIVWVIIELRLYGKYLSRLTAQAEPVTIQPSSESNG